MKLSHLYLALNKKVDFENSDDDADFKDNDYSSDDEEEIGQTSTTSTSNAASKKSTKSKKSKKSTDYSSKDKHNKKNKKVEVQTRKRKSRKTKESDDENSDFSESEEKQPPRKKRRTTQTKRNNTQNESINEIDLLDDEEEEELDNYTSEDESDPDDFLNDNENENEQNEESQTQTRSKQTNTTPRISTRSNSTTTTTTTTTSKTTSKQTRENAQKPKYKEMDENEEEYQSVSDDNDEKPKKKKKKTTIKKQQSSSLPVSKPSPLKIKQFELPFTHNNNNNKQNNILNLQTMPKDMLSIIFSYFGVKQLIVFMRVCKNWYNIINSNGALWKDIEFVGEKVTDENFEQILELRKEYVNSVTLVNASSISHIDVLSRLPKLEDLFLGSCPHIGQNSVGNALIWIDSEKKNRKTKENSELSQQDLETIALIDQVTAAATTSNEQTQTISKTQTQEGEQTLAQIISQTQPKHLPSVLKSLILQHCLPVQASGTIRIISKILQTHRDLEVLALPHSSFNLAHTKLLPITIRELTLDRCPAVTSQCLYAFQNLPSLTRLSLNGCRLFLSGRSSFQIMNFSPLKSLEMANTDVQDSELNLILGNTDELVSLNVSGTVIRGNFITKPQRYSKLKKLVVSWCPRLEQPFFRGTAVTEDDADFYLKHNPIMKLELNSCRNIPVTRRRQYVLNGGTNDENDSSTTTTTTTTSTSSKDRSENTRKQRSLRNSTRKNSSTISQIKVKDRKDEAQDEDFSELDLDSDD